MKLMIATLIDEEVLNTHFFAETEKEFISRICLHISQEFGYIKRYASSEYFTEICEEIEDQVLEVYRIKTYGHTNLQSYKSTKIKKTA